MPTLTVGYLKDYATPALADAAGSPGDDFDLYESDVYGNRTYNMIGTALVTPGTWTAKVPGVYFNFMKRPDINSTSKLKFVGLTIFLNGGWNFTNQHNIHFSRCMLMDGGVNMIGNSAVSGNILLENCIRVSDSNNTNTILFQSALPASTIECWLSTFVVRNVAGDTGRVFFDSGGVLNVGSCIVIGAGSQWAAGVPNYADYNMVHVNSPTQTNGIVKAIGDMGFVGFDPAIGGGFQHDYRVEVGSEEFAPTSQNGKDLTQWPTDLNGRTRSGTEWAVGCVQGYDLLENADFPAETDVRDGVDYNDGVLTGNVGLPVEGDVRDGTFYGANDTEFEGTLDPGSKPDAPTISIAEGDIGSTQVTITIDAADEADEIFVVYRTMPDGEWVLNASFSRIGDGTVTVTGLTDFTRYEFSAYTNNGSCDSTWASTVFAIPTDDTLPLHRQIQLAVAALINGEGYQTSDSTTFTVSTDWPPRWDGKPVPTIFVQPDSFDSEPGSTSTLTRDYGINVAIFEQVKEANSQVENRMTIYEAIQGLLSANTRPVQKAYLSPDSFGDSRAYSASDVERYSFMTPFAVRYRARCNR